jgi:hypothetical protein
MMIKRRTHNIEEDIEMRMRNQSTHIKIATVVKMSVELLQQKVKVERRI